MLMGAAVQRIDLTRVLPFDGFGHVLDDLSVRVLLLVPQDVGDGYDGTPPVVIVSFELTSLRDYAIDLAQRHVRDVTGWPHAVTWVCATHTFSAPHTRSAPALKRGGEELREANGRYLNALMDALDRATAVAMARLEPIAVTYASTVADINVNRNRLTPQGWWKGPNPAGFSDKHVDMLIFRSSRDGNPRAVMFTADVQSSIVAASDEGTGLPQTVSADLTGYASRYVEERQEDCVALFLCGTAADQMPRTDVTVEELGDRLGQAVMAAMTDANVLYMQVPCALAGQRTFTFDGQIPEDGATMRPVSDATSMSGPERHSTICTLVLGPFAMVGVAPELCSVTGAKIRGTSPYVGTLVCTMVNGAQKYMADKSCYDRSTYEARNSCFARGSAERLVRDIDSMLNETQAKEH